MAVMKTISGVELQILIGDGVTPTEGFAHPCTINTERGVNWETGGTDEEIPDCDDPGGMAWNVHTKTSVKGTITGNGKLDADPVVLADFWDWLKTDDTRNVKIKVGDIGGEWAGEWKLTQWNINGTRGTVAETSLTMVSFGEQIYTPPTP